MIPVLTRHREAPIESIRIRLAAILLLAFSVLPVPASATGDAGKPDVSRFQLANGMEVVVIPDRRAPVVTHMVWYKSGSSDDPPGKSGLAHFLEHLMFKGTKNVPAGEFSRKVAEIGGQENAFTTVDFTAYYQKISPEALEMVMFYEADRMANLVLTEEVIAPEKNVVLEERRSRVDSSPASVLGETVAALLYKHHPYGTPIIGWEHEIRELTLDDAMGFYKAHYRPDNAVLVVAGDVEAQQVLALAEANYGRLSPGEGAIPVNTIEEPEPVAARFAEYFDERVTTPSFERYYLVPSYQTGQPGEAEALDLLASILGGSSTARLYRKLIVEDEVATSAGAWFQGASRGLTRFGLFGRPRGKHSVEDVEMAIAKVLEDIMEHGVTQEELDRQRNALLKSVIFERDSQTTLARLYGTVLSLGGTVEDIHEWPQRLAAVTVEDINQVARKYLRPHRSVTSYLRPKP